LLRFYFAGGNFFSARKFLAGIFGGGFLGFLAVRDFWGFCRFGAFEGGIGVGTLMLELRCWNFDISGCPGGGVWALGSLFGLFYDLNGQLTHSMT
jgi:hypothetical protein